MKMLWRNLARKREVAADLDEEIRSYQAMLEDEHLQAGADQATARRRAQLETGGAQQIKEEVQDIRLGSTLEAIASELRQSLRGLRRNPSLTLLAILMLALGMGASTTVFSIFQAALLQPLPFRDPDRLVQVWETRLARNINRTSFSLANFWDVHDGNQSFEGLAACRYEDANLTGIGEPQKVSAISVSAGFLRTLGVTPVLGRDFVEDDVRGGSESSVALLGNAFWTQQFSADVNVLGRTLRLGDRAYTVVGVLPRSHVWLNEQIYIPFGSSPNMNRGSWEYSVIGRLAKGVSSEAAALDLERIATRLDQ
ncbi:MAG: ABC transporter permease, partial [Bryobacterales bacterium]|nr:ABC transporter permease [Bryobacterales bacterium]